MPPASAQKGTSKKNAGPMPKQSRNSTPAPSTSSLPPQEPYDPDYLNTRVILFKNLNQDDLIDSNAFHASVPDSRSVDAMLEKLKSLSSIMEKRSTFYDRGMRFIADEKKKRPDDYDRTRNDGEPEAKRPKHKKKKGSDSLAPPDSGNAGTTTALFPIVEAIRFHCTALVGLMRVLTADPLRTIVAFARREAQTLSRQ